MTENNMSYFIIVGLVAIVAIVAMAMMVTNDNDVEYVPQTANPSTIVAVDDEGNVVGMGTTRGSGSRTAPRDTSRSASRDDCSSNFGQSNQQGLREECEVCVENMGLGRCEFVRTTHRVFWWTLSSYDCDCGSGDTRGSTRGY